MVRRNAVEGLVFSLKGPRFTTNRRVLAEAGESIARFFASGVAELKEKLGPINWQFMATKKFEAADFGKFLALLPKEIGGRPIRHAVEVRHESFRTPDFVALAREHGVAIVIAGDSEFPQIADVTADFVYLRIMGTQEKPKPDMRQRRSMAGPSAPGFLRPAAFPRIWRCSRRRPRKRRAMSFSMSSAASRRTIRARRRR